MARKMAGRLTRPGTHCPFFCQCDNAGHTVVGKHFDRPNRIFRPGEEMGFVFVGTQHRGVPGNLPPPRSPVICQEARRGRIQHHVTATLDHSVHQFQQII
jgi:hypothetical protein